MFRFRLLAFVLVGSACEGPPRDSDAAISSDPVAAFWASVGDPAALLLPTPPDDGDYREFPQDPLNPITDAKVVLGRELFHEPGLAVVTRHDEGRYTYSCASCHNPAAGFGAGTRIGRGMGDGGTGDLDARVIRATYSDEHTDYDLGPLNEMRSLNLAWRAEIAGWQGEFDPAIPAARDRSTMLAAGHQGLEAYVQASLVSHGFWTASSEPPGASVLSDESELDGSLTWRALFVAAFPTSSDAETVSQLHAAMALAAYLRTVVANEAPLQQMLRTPTEQTEDLPMSDEALAGAALFFGDGRCSVCHVGPGLNASAFHTTGLAVVHPDELLPVESGDEVSLPEILALRVAPSVMANLGRYNTTADEADTGAFAVPTVYGAGGPHVHRWGHGAYHDTLFGFLRAKTAGPDWPELDPRLNAHLSPVLHGEERPRLTDEEITQIVAFIEEGLEDPTLEERFGKPDHQSLSGLSTPNAD